MPRRTASMGDVIADPADYDALLANLPGREPEPWELAAAREADDSIPSVLIMGCPAWPLPGQDRRPAGPDLGRVAERCHACKNRRRPGHFCLACSKPVGSLVGSARAEVRRVAALAARVAKQARKERRKILA